MTTEQQIKALEEELKAEREFNKFILQEIPYLVLMVDNSGNVSAANPTVLKILGMKEENVLGSSWKMLLHEDDREDIKYMLGDDGSVSFKARLVCANENVRRVDWNVLNHHLNKKNYNMTAFMLSGRDMTEHMERETQEVQRQKMEALGHLAGGVAHEMNNLLQPILMSSQMMLPEAEESNNEYYLKNLDRITRNAKAAAKIVEDILLFSRNEEKETEVLEVVSLLEEALAFVKEMIPATLLVSFEADQSIEGCKVKINHTEMIQIIANMLINAGHAMEQEGEVNLNANLVALSAAKAEGLNLEVGQYIQIDIIDTGYGIKEEYLGRVFDPFFTTKEPGEGTGLGLSIVYRIIKEWGGIVTVKSKINVGTTFSIYIPLAPSES